MSTPADDTWLQRRRQPRPVLKRRIASGRGAMEQPNATGDLDVPLTPRFWTLVVLTGIGTGLIAVLLMLLLFSVSDLAYGHNAGRGSFQNAVEAASWVRRVVPLAIAGTFAGIGGFLLRRWTPGLRADVDDIIWTGDDRLSFRRGASTSILSEVVVGLGASLGREAAPKLMGGVWGSLLARWNAMTPAQSQLLVACGAGAGLAAVYNVPLGGALLTAEVLCGTIRLPVMLPSLACCGIATLTTWIALPAVPTYIGVPAYSYHGSIMVWSLIAGPLIGLLSTGFVRFIAWTSHRQARGRWVLVAPMAAFLILAAVGQLFPQLYGNGKDMAHDAFLGIGSLALFAALSLLKPLLTCACLASSAPGGLFTPTMSTGAVLGAALGSIWSFLWPGAPLGAYAVVGAAAMIGAGMQAPLAALALIVELTHSGFALMVPMIAATVTATVTARYLDGYSIYSARLSARLATSSDSAAINLNAGPDIDSSPNTKTRKT